MRKAYTALQMSNKCNLQAVAFLVMRKEK